MSVKIEKVYVVSVVGTTETTHGSIQGLRVVTVGYDGLLAYKASKLANALFTRELARRLWDQSASLCDLEHSPWTLND
jgi:NAD(P)-dependent dehydrogenase (short-subunit alcohol dehydrogenase family)